MSNELMQIFAECVEAIEEGRLTVDECLQKYESHRHELCELLLLTGELHNLPTAVPEPGFRESANARLMAKMLIGTRSLNGTGPAVSVPVMVALSKSFSQRLRTIPSILAQVWPFSLRSTWAVGMGTLAFCVLLFGLMWGGGGFSSADTNSVRSDLIPAQDRAASVEVLEGAVEVMNVSGKWEAVNKVATVMVGQRVRTRDLSSAKLTFSDGSSTSIGSNREITIGGTNAVLPVLGPSSTPTATVGFTATPTPTASFTATPTPTVSFTATPTPTVSFTATPTPTIGVTPTATPTVGLTITPSPTPTIGLTPTPTPVQGVVTICHKPGTPAEQTKTIPQPALNGHLGHGDTMGPCQQATSTVPAPTATSPGPTATSPAPTGTSPAPSATPELPTPTPNTGGDVTICHKPGTPAQRTMTVRQSALPAHLAHGDTMGACK